MKSPVTQIQSDILKMAKMMQLMSIHEPDFLKQSTNRKLKGIYKKYKIRAKNQIFLALEKDSSSAMTSLVETLNSDL